MSEPTLNDRFHLIGIGGAGMSVVAELLRSRGAIVEGSDREDSAVLEHLRAVGVRVYVGMMPPTWTRLPSRGVHGDPRE